MAKTKDIILEEGTRFHVNNRSLTYTIRKIEKDGIWIVWPGVEMGSFYSEHEAIGYFNNGTWIITN
jgi:hypothetical protein